MTTLTSNVPLSAPNYDPNMAGLTAIAVMGKHLWVTCPSKNSVMVYKKSGVHVQSYSVNSANGVVTWGCDMLVSSSTGGIYTISPASNSTVLSASNQGKVSAIATYKKKRIYVATDGSVIMYNSTFQPVQKYVDSGLSSFGYMPMGMTVNCGDLYVVYNNSNPITGNGYVNVFQPDGNTRLINRGQLALPMAVATDGSSLWIANASTGMISTYTMKGKMKCHTCNKHGCALTYVGVMGMVYSPSDQSLYLAVSADDGRIGSIEMISV
jgi:hypothetical protein